jgi:hypothetical protein
VRDLRHGEPSGQRKPSRDPRGPMAVVPRSGAHDVPLLWPFQASPDIIKDTTEELRIITAQRTGSNKVAQLHPAPSSSGEVSPDVIIQDAKEGTRGGKKRRKQHHQKNAPMINDNSDISKEAGGSIMACTMAITDSGKRQARPPMDHFTNLLKETWLNHANPIKHRLRECGMMKNFMASGSLTRGMEVDEVPDEGDTMPFPREDAVMMIYVGRPPAGDAPCV